MTVPVRIHEDDYRPHVTLDSGSNYYLRVSWTTELNALYDSALRSSSNFRQSPEYFVGLATPEYPVVEWVDLLWWQYIKPSIRTLYCHVEARLEGEPWVSISLWAYVVNHNPIANAGPPTQIGLGNTGQVLADVTLDGSGSFDQDLYDPLIPDPGPLHYDWRVEDTPPTIDTSGIVYSLASSLNPVSNPIFLPRFTIVPPIDQGVYQFHLTVSDNDISEIGVNTGKPGRDTSVTTVVIQAPPPNLSIVTPTDLVPARWNSQSGGFTRIVYTIGDNLATGGTLGGAWMLRLSITQASNWTVTLNPTPVGTVVYEQTRIDPQLFGNFFWNGIMTNPDPAINGRPAEGVFNVRLELLDRNAVPTADPATIVSRSNCIIIYATRSQQLCVEILNTPNIVLRNAHFSNIPDSATPLDNIQDVANGNRASQSAFGNATVPADPTCPCAAAPGVDTNLDPDMLQCLLDAADTWDLIVSEIAGGCHSCGSAHYGGRAFDVWQINGAVANAGNGQSGPFAAFCIAQGAADVRGPVAPATVDGGHPRHVHAAW